MADYRIKLSDGIDTIDLYGGSDTQVRDAGFGLLPPNAITSFIGNPTFDGNRLGQARYGNRTISLTVKIVGTTVSDLKDNIRTVQRLLNDAQERTLLGFGSQVFLEYQWGDTINDSVFYDVIRGDLVLPRGFQTVTMSVGFTILDAQLNLICKPFARYIEQDIAQATLENSQSRFEVSQSHTSDNSTHVLNAANDWEAQTFTVGASAVTLVAAAIKCYRGAGDTLGDITFAIYAADASHLPTGSALATGATSGNNIHDGSVLYPGWLFCVFDASVTLTATDKYALVVHGASLGAADALNWRVDTAAGFANGQRAFSTDGGSSWDADATDDFAFAIFIADTDENYQDITTAAAYGDAPAALFYKLAQTGATGTEKIWIAKRSGIRQLDALWIEGEDVDTATDLAGTGVVIVQQQPIFEAGISGDMYYQGWHKSGAGGVAADVSLTRWDWTINDVPRGQFRVLARVRIDNFDAADFDHISFGFGWSYGDKTYTPTGAQGEFFTVAADNTWQMLDLGVINIPPVAESDIAITNSFELRLFTQTEDSLTINEDYKWACDYIFLLPIDEGVVIVDQVDTGDVVASDGITDPPNVFILSATNVIEDFPDYVGNPFQLGRESTRIYVLRDDAKTVTFSSNVKFQPRFMVA